MLEQPVQRFDASREHQYKERRECRRYCQYLDIEHGGELDWEDELVAGSIEAKLEQYALRWESTYGACTHTHTYRGTESKSSSGKHHHFFMSAICRVNVEEKYSMWKDTDTHTHTHTRIIKLRITLSTYLYSAHGSEREHILIRDAPAASNLDIETKVSGTRMHPHVRSFGN